MEDSNFEILTNIFFKWVEGNHQPVQIQMFFPVVNLLVGFGHAMIMAQLLRLNMNEPQGLNLFGQYMG